jgi:hypothetical protein
MLIFIKSNVFSESIHCSNINNIIMLCGVTTYVPIHNGRVREREREREREGDIDHTGQGRRNNSTKYRESVSKLSTLEHLPKLNLNSMLTRL